MSSSNNNNNNKRKRQSGEESLSSKSDDVEGRVTMMIDHNNNNNNQEGDNDDDGPTTVDISPPPIPPGKISAGGGAGTRFHGWLDEGSTKSDGRIEHESFALSIGDEVFEISLGDAVITRKKSSSSSSSTTAGADGGGGKEEEEEDDDHISFGDMDDSFDYYGSTTDNNNNKNNQNKNKKTADDIDYFMIARVERIWEEEEEEDLDDDGDVENNQGTKKNGQLKFLARWFLRIGEVESLRGNFSGGVKSTEEFLSKLSAKDLVLGDQTDANPLTSICGTVQVVYRNPESDKVLPEMPPNLYVCRYSASICDDEEDEDEEENATNNDTEGSRIEVIPFTGEDDEWPGEEEDDDEEEGDEDESDENQSRGQIEHTRSTENSMATTGGSLSSSSDSEEQQQQQRNRSSAATAAFDEGTTEKRDIRIGPGHQAIVPPYVPNQRSVSRKPTQVWKPGKISNDDMDRYLTKAAEILTRYLRSNNLTHTEPYSPLQWEKMEELYKSLGGSGPVPTLSTVCTASSLSSSSSGLIPRVHMLRECDPDKTLAVLYDKNYNVDSAIASIEANPRDFLTLWSPQEKDLFSSGFRRYSGSLRMIYKGIAPSKDFKDVIDYHYRFKIPDQYRSFQDKKREQAVRMMECIETRRNIAAAIPNSSFGNFGAEPSAKKRIVESEWPKTSISDLTGAVEDRRINAKKLLLDIESKMGKEKLVEVVDIIKRLNQRSIPTNLRAIIVDICNGHPEFEQRLLEFLPQRFD